MCGTEVPRTRRVLIEGTVLMVCSECSKFGVESKAGSKLSGPGIVSRGLQVRQRRMRSKDIFADETEVLVSDYSKRIQAARVVKGWKQQDLARRLNEKLSVVSKLEKGDMRPSEKLVRKLERVLEITLTERMVDETPARKRQLERGLTLGDLIKRESK